jgi:hypothetical protein
MKEPKSPKPTSAMARSVIQTGAFWSAGAAAARMSLLYGVVWCVVAIGLVIFDRRLWGGPAPAPATVQPAYGGESRVR